MVGYDAALLTGFKHATGDIIVTMDSDGQHNPEEITDLIKPIINNNADFVIGSRYLGKWNYRYPLYARVGAYFIKAFFRALFLQRVRDNQSGFRAFKKEIIKILENIRYTGMGFSTELLFEVAYNQLKIVEIPISSNPRRYGTSNVHLVRIIRSISSCILNYILRKMKNKRQLLESEFNFNQISTKAIKNFEMADFKTDFSQKNIHIWNENLNLNQGIETLAILPAYNLENVIGDIVKRTNYYVDKVIVISDGSSDKTYLNAKSAGAMCPPHTNTRGKGYAIRKGIEYSKVFKPKFIILMDSDGQHLPEEIPKLIHTLKTEEKDMVIGSRFRGILKTSLINRFGNVFLNFLSMVLNGKWFSDIESGFRAFIAKKLYNLNLNTNHYEIDYELLLKSIHRDFKITEVPITVTKAIPGITILDGIKVALFAIKKAFLTKTRR